MLKNRYIIFKNLFFNYVLFKKVDGYYDIQKGMDDMIGKTSRLFTIFFILIGHFLLFNIFIGVNILTIQESNRNYNEKVIKFFITLLKYTTIVKVFVYKLSILYLDLCYNYFFKILKKNYFFSLAKLIMVKSMKQSEYVYLFICFNK